MGAELWSYVFYSSIDNEQFENISLVQIVCGSTRDTKGVHLTETKIIARAQRVSITSDDVPHTDTETFGG